MKKNAFTRWLTVGQALASGAGRQREEPTTRLRLTRASTWLQHSKRWALIPHWAIRLRFLAVLSEPGMPNTPSFRRMERQLAPRVK